MEARISKEVEPAGRFEEYRAWLAERWAVWRRINGVGPRETLTYAHYQAFDAWLALCSARSQVSSAA